MKNRKPVLILALVLALAVILGLVALKAGWISLPDDSESMVQILDQTTEPSRQQDPATPEQTTGGLPQQTAEEESGQDPTLQTQPQQTDPAQTTLDEDGWYNTKEEVALYIHLYGRLPGNYITKKQAEALGWTGGSLEPYAPGKSIGGSYFGNYEGLLPKAKDRKYTECDIDTAGKSSRGAKRIVFSNDGLIYYTDDHYESFELLYGEP